LHLDGVARFQRGPNAHASTVIPFVTCHERDRPTTGGDETARGLAAMKVNGTTPGNPLVLDQLPGKVLVS
jgi:hypothetical protein